MQGVGSQRVKRWENEQSQNLENLEEDSLFASQTMFEMLREDNLYALGTSGLDMICGL